MKKNIFKKKSCFQAFLKLHKESKFSNWLGILYIFIIALEIILSNWLLAVIYSLLYSAVYAFFLYNAWQHNLFKKEQAEVLREFRRRHRGYIE
jgi:hypothetical protein